jgi:arylsulfatase A-like enzyme
MPTFLDAAGATLKPDVAARSLLRWVIDGEGHAREFVVSELGATVAVRTATHKLVVDRVSPSRLYDLEADPRETRDAAAEQADEVALLERHLRAWRAALQPIAPGDETLDDETVEGLRALGYLDD